MIKKILVRLSDLWLCAGLSTDFLIAFLVLGLLMVGTVAVYVEELLHLYVRFPIRQRRDKIRWLLAVYPVSIGCFVPRRTDSWSYFRLSVLCLKIHADILSRVVHGSDGPAGRVGSRFCRILAGRVSTSDFLVFTDFFWYLNRYEWIFDYCFRIDCFSKIFNIYIN